jgi:hypothetical protein
MDADMARALARSNKLKLPKFLESLQLYGDARARFEYRNGERQGSDDDYDRNRWRLRVRLGLQGEYRENFFYGIRLETGSGSRSTNLTEGEGGPSAKGGNYAIQLGRLYLGWKPSDQVTVVVGRQEIPFVTTSLVWDDDLNPEGFVEKLSWQSEKVDVFANLGQFIYADFDENKFGGGGKEDVWMFGWQVGAKAKLPQDVTLTVAPTLYHYLNENNYSGNRFTGNGANNTAINDLMVVEVPMEAAFKAGPVPVKIFGDVAINTRGASRARANNDTAHNDQYWAYQAGLSLGASKKKGDWMLKAYWQHTELYALDPNLVDSDLFDARLNMEGFVVQGSYNFTDFLTGKVTYANAQDINSALPTLTGAGDLKNDLHQYQLWQADLSWKF